MKIFNNESLENISNLPIGVYQMIYIDNSFILISDTSSNNNSSSDMLYDQDVRFQVQDQRGIAETGIYIPDKYNFVNIIIYQGNTKRGNIYSRELLENNESRFFNLLPFDYDDFVVSVNTKDNYLFLQSYYGMTAITHLKVEGIK